MEISGNPSKAGTGRKRFVSGTIRFGMLFLLGILLAGLVGTPKVQAAANCADEATTGVPRIECEALVALYESANGPGWSNSENWNTTTAASTWHGVTLMNERVAVIQLPDNQLAGPIPPELGNLETLSFLFLNSNQLTGAIPPELGNLQNLAFLNLTDNQMTGEIPAALGSLPKLGVLGLKGNRLSGTIPAELGNLERLQSLALGSNRLSGEIPANIRMLENLTTLGIGYNMLTAADPELVAFLDGKSPGWADTQTVPPTGLAIGNVATNSVEIAWTPIAYTGDGGHYRVKYGSDPGGPYVEAGRTGNKSASNFTVAGLAPDRTYHFVVETFTPTHGNNANPLLSPVGEEISASTAILCANTEITGIPRNECEALVALYESTSGAGWNLDTNWNTATAANSWHGVTVAGGHVTELKLPFNQLSGTLPPEMGNLPELQMIQFPQNQLGGPIPPELGSLEKLKDIWFLNNSLTDAIPSELGNLTNLERLHLEGNLLDGPIPSALGDLANLTGLYLGFNRLSGEVPLEIAGLTNLNAGSMGYNMLTASDADVRAFLDGIFPGWSDTQTVPPTDPAIGNAGPTAIRLVWTPIAYTGNEGHYRVHFAADSAGPYALAGTTADKSASEYTVAGLFPETTYHFFVETFTKAHSSQKSDLTSPPTAVISGTTTEAAQSGDVNDDGAVDLADAILILKILAGIDTGDAVVTWSADANGDDRIGLEDLIYRLRVVSMEN